MKYLKKYNENTHFDELELLNFSQMYLAYLTDEGFGVSIRENAYSNSKNLSIILFYKIVDGDTIAFNWDSIKDHFISFVEILNKNYTVSEIWYKEKRVNHNYDENQITYQSLVNDLLENKELSTIAIYVKRVNKLG